MEQVEKEKSVKKSGKKNKVKKHKKHSNKFKSACHWLSKRLGELTGRADKDDS